MQSVQVVLLQSDPQTAQALMAPLAATVSVVTVTQSVADLRSLAKNGAEVLVLDLEAATLGDVEKMRQEFPELVIVCTHRLADEALWAEALNAGASDCCASQDTGGILQAVLRRAARAQAA